MARTSRTAFHLTDPLYSIIPSDRILQKCRHIRYGIDDRRTWVLWSCEDQSTVSPMLRTTLSCSWSSRSPLACCWTILFFSLQWLRTGSHRHCTVLNGSRARSKATCGTCLSLLPSMSQVRSCTVNMVLSYIPLLSWALTHQNCGRDQQMLTGLCTFLSAHLSLTMYPMHLSYYKHIKLISESVSYLPPILMRRVFTEQTVTVTSEVKGRYCPIQTTGP